MERRLSNLPEFFYSIIDPERVFIAGKVAVLVRGFVELETNRESFRLLATHGDYITKKIMMENTTGFKDKN